MRLLWLSASLVAFGQFDYDRTLPLDAKHEPLAERTTARMWGGNFSGVNYVLVEPKWRGRAARRPYPGVVFQHGGGQSMSNYITEALMLAELGVTSLLVDAEGGRSRETVVNLVVNERKALDLLLRQPGVDRKRIAYVGHSYGSLAGGILSGVEPRVSAFVLLGALPSLAKHIEVSANPYWAPLRGRDDYRQVLAGIAEVDAERFLPLAKAPILVQCAQFDTPDNLRACPEVHRLAGGPKTLTWYEEDHNFTSYEAMRDRLRWLDSQWKLGGVDRVLMNWAKRR